MSHASTITILVALVGAGCSSTPNPVESNISYGPEDRFANRVLDASERAEVLAIMRASVDGPADDPATPAPLGVRWSDVRLAAVEAGGTLELALLSMSVEENGTVKRLQMISVGDTPVELVVRLVPTPKVYEVSASAGLFGDNEELAASLVDAFNEAMRAWGAKPGWEPLSNG